MGRISTVPLVLKILIELNWKSFLSFCVDWPAGHTFFSRKNNVGVEQTRVMRNEIKRLDTVVTHTMCWCELRRGQRPAGLICGPFCCLRGIFSSIDDENSRRRLAGTWEKPKSHSRYMQIAFLTYNALRIINVTDKDFFESWPDMYCSSNNNHHSNNVSIC